MIHWFKIVLGTVMSNSVLSAFNFNLLFSIETETSWRQPLSPFWERLLTVVAIKADMNIPEH